MANTQTILLLCFKISTLTEENKVDLSMVQMAMSYVIDKAREVARWGR